MIYLKTQIGEGIEIKIDVYGDEFYTRCPQCGKEINVDSEALHTKDTDFGSTQIFCNECSKDRQKIDEYINNIN